MMYELESIKSIIKNGLLFGMESKSKIEYEAVFEKQVYNWSREIASIAFQLNKTERNVFVRNVSPTSLTLAT